MFNASRHHALTGKKNMFSKFPRYVGNFAGNDEVVNIVGMTKDKYVTEGISKSSMESPPNSFNSFLIRFSFLADTLSSLNDYVFCIGTSYIGSESGLYFRINNGLEVRYFDGGSGDTYLTTKKHSLALSAGIRYDVELDYNELYSEIKWTINGIKDTISVTNFLSNQPLSNFQKTSIGGVWNNVLNAFQRGFDGKIWNISLSTYDKIIFAIPLDDGSGNTCRDLKSKYPGTWVNHTDPNQWYYFNIEP